MAGELIECVARRQGGSRVTLGGIEYYFRPRPEEGITAHVAEVKNKSHTQRLLSITEGYRFYEEPDTEGEPVDPGRPPDEPRGAVLDPTTMSDAALEKIGMTELAAWAKRHLVNGGNRQEIERWGNLHGIHVDRRKTQENMLRELASKMRDKGIVLEDPYQPQDGDPGGESDEE